MVKKVLGKSWETSTAGIAGFLAIIGLLMNQHFDGDPETVPQWGLLIPAITALIVAWRARDNNKKSEDVGASPRAPKDIGIGGGNGGSEPPGNAMTLLLCASLGFMSIGCGPGHSLNMQRSGLRASGDLAITLFLDNNPTSKVDAKTHADKAMAFLETGGVMNLPVGKVADKLGELIPTKYKDWVAQALAVAVIQANQAVVDVNKIGANNLARLQAFVRGVQTGADLFVEPTPSTTEGGDPSTDVGANMRFRPLLCFRHQVPLRNSGGVTKACVTGTHQRLGRMKHMATTYNVAA